MQRPQGLIEVRLDVTASEVDRDDAAMDLAAYDEPEVARLDSREALAP